MRIEVIGKNISGVVEAPSSKSAMQRYVAGALLAEGATFIYSPTFCDDSKASLGIAEALGAKIEITNEYVKISGGFKPVSSKIFCGESGLATRMFTPIAALHNDVITIEGKGSVLKRPLTMMEAPLRELGAEADLSNGFLPMRIKGPIKGGSIHTDGSISSQFITGLLMALAVVKDDSEINVTKLTSKPYIDLTVSVLKDFGIEVRNSGYEVFHIKGGQKYKPGKYTVEGDWSGAAFLLVSGALAGEVSVKNLNLNSVQADKAIIEVLKRAGAKISGSGTIVNVTKDQLNAFTFDITDCPDLAPPIAVLALACKGKSVITGTERLKSKESDRGKALEETLSILGGNIRNLGESIVIEGKGELTGGSADACNDHRIAMALSVASLISRQPVVINGMECINKSYPEFTDDFTKMGGLVKQL
jgi:3-phosphoshikimate 1-carboxyvinyltransferase